MAWARDIASGEPIYILELDATRTGGDCACECPSCDLALVAINAAKEKYRKRPHFRHPNGAEKSECMFLSARLAALHLLREQGVLMLPGRRISARIAGLSGFEYEAWVEMPPERVHVRDFNFHDKVAAILTLDDGRKLRIQLIGTGASPTSLDSAGLPIPTVILDLQDMTIASMSPEDLRSRITLVPENLCWVNHWSDPDLQAQAQEGARRLAAELLDFDPEDESLLSGADAEFRHETLLHFEVKRILAESKEIQVPALIAVVTKHADRSMPVNLIWSRSSELIQFFDVMLEQRFGRVIPDVMTKVSDQYGAMMIEVTVTNQISDERLARIRELNMPALEINLSQSGGRISRADLKTLVIHGINTKRWLHHPEIAIQEQILEAKVDAKIEELRQEKAERARVMAMPLQAVATEYLNAVSAFAKSHYDKGEFESIHDAIDEKKKAVILMAENLAIHGYPGASDPQLIRAQRGIIPRLLSIQSGCSITNPDASTLDVMNEIRCDNFAENCRNITIYLMAENAYRTIRLADLPDWFTRWVNDIKQSIGAGEGFYLREGTLDKLLALLFPEIAPGLAKGYGSVVRKNKQAVSKIVHSTPTSTYSTGINFDDVLKDSRWLRVGDKFGKWFEIWSDRYGLNYELGPIAAFLQANGFENAIDELHAWNAYVKQIRDSGRKMPSRSFTESGYEHSSWKRPAVETPKENQYALLKGRNGPR